MGFMKPDKPDTSKQEALIRKQQKALDDEKAAAKREADRLRDKRIASSKSGKSTGRQGLIKTSELGVKDKLGQKTGSA